MRSQWRCSRSGASSISPEAAMRAKGMALAFAVIACAPVAYIEPLEGDTASLRIENQGPAIFGYALEADTYENAAACSGRLRLAGAKTLQRGVAHTVRV